MRVFVKSVYKFIIIGAFKCGQTSIVKYLECRYPKCIVKNLECIYYDNLPNKDWLRTYKDYTKIIIIRRNKGQALLSSWRYFEPGMNLEEYKKTDIMDRIDFDRWIKKWSSANPIVLELEEMKLNPNFPKLNVNVSNPLPEHYRE